MRNIVPMLVFAFLSAAFAVSITGCALTVLPSSPLPPFSAELATPAGAPDAAVATPHPEAVPTGTTAQTAPVDKWRELLQANPFPYTAPVPPPVSTALDSLYVKQEPAGLLVEHVHCRRCPDWLHEPGLWKLSFDKGAYRVLHVDRGWRAIGSYMVSTDQLVLFNDANCLEDTRRGELGFYRWKQQDGALTFQVIDDPCAIKLRGANLGHMPWQSCQPPTAEAAATGRWQMPRGCS